MGGGNDKEKARRTDRDHPDGVDECNAADRSSRRTQLRVTYLFKRRLRKLGSRLVLKCGDALTGVATCRILFTWRWRSRSLSRDPREGHDCAIATARDQRGKIAGECGREWRRNDRNEPLH